MFAVIGSIVVYFIIFDNDKIGMLRKKNITRIVRLSPLMYECRLDNTFAVRENCLIHN